MSEDVTFVPIEEIPDETFDRVYEFVIHKTPLDLVLHNEAVRYQFGKTIVEFLSYIILIGEHLNRFEECRALLNKKEEYERWVKVNLETASSIFKLVESLKDNNKNEGKRHED